MSTAPSPPEVDLVIASVAMSAVAPTDRRALTLDAADVVAVADHARSHHPGFECVVIATCHRTEIALAGISGGTPATPRVAIEMLHGGIAAVRPGRAPCLQTGADPTVHVGRAAVDHLFRMACGIESPLVGEVEILGQLRRAWRDAERLGTAGARLRTVFRDAFAVGKRARATTEISVGGAGLGSAVSAAVGARPGSVVVIGAGQAGRTVSRRLAKSQRSITIANRSLDRAAAIADEVDGRAIALDELEGALADADVVVGATSRPSPIISAAVVRSIRERRPHWNPLVIDVATQPTVEPGAGLVVVPLDRLADRESEVAARRLRAIPAVERTVKSAVDRHLARSSWEDRRSPHPPGRPLGHPEPPSASIAAAHQPNKEHAPCAY